MKFRNAIHGFDSHNIYIIDLMIKFTSCVFFNSIPPFPLRPHLSSLFPYFNTSCVPFYSASNMYLYCITLFIITMNCIIKIHHKSRKHILDIQHGNAAKSHPTEMTSHFYQAPMN